MSRGEYAGFVHSQQGVWRGCSGVSGRESTGGEGGLVGLCFYDTVEGLAFPLSVEEARGVLGAERHYCKDLRGSLRLLNME